MRWQYTLGLYAFIFAHAFSGACAHADNVEGRVASITVTGSGGLASAELVLDLDIAGTLHAYRLDAATAPQVFAAIAVVLDEAMHSQRTITVSYIPEPQGSPNTPLFSQVVVTRATSLNERRSRHRKN
jgi:hypothetical protein